MSEQTVHVPVADLEKMMEAPMALAQIEAMRLVQAGDLVGGFRKVATAVTETMQFRAQIQPQLDAARQAAAAPVVVAAQPDPAAPAAPAPPAAPTAPLAAPGTPPPHTPIIPVEQAPDESLGHFYMRRGAAMRQAATAAPDGRFDLSRSFGLPRR